MDHHPKILKSAGSVAPEFDRSIVGQVVASAWARDSAGAGLVEGVLARCWVWIGFRCMAVACCIAVQAAAGRRSPVVGCRWPAASAVAAVGS